jgi:hypothetical protein
VGHGVEALVGELLHLLLPVPQLDLGLVLGTLPVVFPLLLAEGVPHFAEALPDLGEAAGNAVAS